MILDIERGLLKEYRVFLELVILKTNWFLNKFCMFEETFIKETINFL